MEQPSPLHPGKTSSYTPDQCGQTKFTEQNGPVEPPLGVFMSQDPDPQSLPAKVLDYPARDMTITVETDLSYGELQQILAREGQQLPIDVADDSITLATMIHSDLCGPREFGCGTLRDYVIGIEAIDGHGRRFHGGGKVVKNVAGYDLCRLLVGSEQRFGRLISATLKVVPVLADSCLVCAGFASAAELEATLSRLNTSQTTPVLMDLICSGNIDSFQAVSGFADAVARGTQTGDKAAAFLVLGFTGPENVCRWQAETAVAELQQGSSTAFIIPNQAVFQSWCRTACRAASGTLPAAPEWLLELRILPSLVASITFQLLECGCRIYGRAGNGRLWVQPDPSGTSPEGLQDSQALALMQSAAASCNGSLKLIVGSADLPDMLPDSVQQLVSQLQLALGSSTLTESNS